MSQTTTTYCVIYARRLAKNIKAFSSLTVTMTMSYATNKAHIYAWNAKNIERKRELERNYGRKRYHWKKICSVFRNILIDDLAVNT